MEDLGSELRGIRSRARDKRNKKKAWAELSPLEQEAEEMRLEEEAKQAEEDQRLYDDGVKQARAELDDIRVKLRAVAVDEDTHDLEIARFRAQLGTYLKEFSQFDESWPIEPFAKGYAATVWQFAVDSRLCPHINRDDDWIEGEGHLFRIIARW
ncbi:MAG: hypothetical protein U9Q03_05045 [Patescibacteria group bacterium]|nr:hypothetical protein [Patescibacteria group bacterium]